MTDQIEDQDVELDEDIEEAHDPKNAEADSVASVDAAEEKGPKAKKRKGDKGTSEPMQKMSGGTTKAESIKFDGDFSEDLDALVESEATLSEEFKAKTAVIFEAAGADAIFAEAMEDLEMYQKVVDAVNIPVLANITEFGSTPGFTVEELASVGISMALYPLSAFRAMNQAALNVYRTLRKEGTQQSVISTMQTRAELYEFLGYHEYEDKLDELFSQDGQNI